MLTSSNSKTAEWAARFLAHDTPVSLVAGQSAIVNLRIENSGLNQWLHNGRHAVHLGYRWFSAAGEQLRDAEDRRTGLPSDVYPRQETCFGAILVAPKTPGTYTLQWDLVAEGTTWFADAGSVPLRVPIAVTAAPQDTTGWRIESNVNIAQVADILNGDPRTFWDSGVPQSAGQWLRLNLGAPRVVDGIQLLSPGKGFPVGYTLRLSADGKTWTQIAHVALDNSFDVMAIFAPQPMQYAQIDLLAPAPSHWMVSEILIHAAVRWEASASHNSKAAALALDNRVETSWGSGAPQTPAMWFQVDLGQSELVNGLALSPPNDEHPAGYRVAVWNASMNRWQSVAEKLDNTESVDLTFTATLTQFINIQLLQSSQRPWAIQQVRVSREMERWLGPSK